MTTMTPAAIRELESLGACREAVAWVREQRSVAQAWRDCQRGDWMLWLIGRKVEMGSSEHRTLVLCACECARLSLPYVPTGEDRPRVAIETTEAWARGEATIEQVRAAAYAAYAAASAAAYAAYAAASAASYTASAAAASNAAYAARQETLSDCADIVRKHYPRAPRLD